MISTGSVGYLLLITGAIGFLLMTGLLVKRRPTSYYFFSLTLLVTSYSALLLAAVKSKWLLSFPHLFLTAQPLQYLIGPACYYFALFTVNPYHKFRKIELLHFLPFLLHLLELMPFYLLDRQEKLVILEECYRVAESVLILPNEMYLISYFQHIFLKTGSMFLYSTAGLLLIWGQYRRSMSSYQKYNHLIFKWATLEMILKIVLGLAGMVRAVWNSGYPGIDQFFSVMMAIDTIIGFGFILLNPRILEGASPVKVDFPPIFGESADESMEQEVPVPRDTEQTLAVHESEKDIVRSKKFQFIESYFQTQKPFLKEEFSRETLALETGLTKKIISEEIKSATGMNFSDYVNSYRIRYLEENATLRPEWKKYTVDALGAEIGFFNRGSFYNAVKRHRNMTAGQLLKNLELGDRE